MQQTGTTGPLTGTIGPKCSFPGLGPGSTPIRIYLTQKPVLILPTRTAKPLLPKNIILWQGPNPIFGHHRSKRQRSSAETRNTPTLDKPHQRFPLTPSSIGNIITSNINARRMTKVHLAVRAGADYHFEVAHPEFSISSTFECETIDA